MKVVCDASKKCPIIEPGLGPSCDHHEPHEPEDGCKWSCSLAKHQNKTGKCVPVKEDES